MNHQYAPINQGSESKEDFALRTGGIHVCLQGRVSNQIVWSKLVGVELNEEPIPNFGVESRKGDLCFQHA